MICSLIALSLLFEGKRRKHFVKINDDDDSNWDGLSFDEVTERRTINDTMSCVSYDNASKRMDGSRHTISYTPQQDVTTTSNSSSIEVILDRRTQPIKAAAVTLNDVVKDGISSSQPSENDLSGRPPLKESD